MRIPKWGLPFLYLLYFKSYCKKKQKNSSFMRFSDHYLNISLGTIVFSFHYIDMAMIQSVYNFFTISKPQQHLDLALSPVGH